MSHGSAVTAASSVSERAFGYLRGISWPAKLTGKHGQSSIKHAATAAPSAPSIHALDLSLLELVFAMSTVLPPTLHTMRDPIPPPTMLVQLTQPLADKLDLKTMPYHVHEILIGFLAYHFILYGLSPAVSKLLWPKTYAGFNRRTRLNWDIHWVSMIQALFINGAALYVIFTDPERKEMDWKGRLWGYTPASGMVQGFAAGYFLWDLQVCLQHFSICGVGALVHAIGALAITCIGFV